MKHHLWNFSLYNSCPFFPFIDLTLRHVIKHIGASLEKCYADLQTFLACSETL